MALLASDSQNQFSVTIDGRAYPVIKKIAGESVYEVAKGLSPGLHNLTLTRRTESLFGRSGYLGLSADHGPLQVSANL